MSIGHTLSTLALKRPRVSAHDEAELTDSESGPNGAGPTSEQALGLANERTWITLEMILAGPQLAELLNDDGLGFAGRLSDVIDGLFQEIATEEFRRSDPEWRQACWNQLRAARQAGLLELPHRSQLETNSPTIDHFDSQFLARLCDSFERSAWYCLRPLLEMKTSDGVPLFLSLVQWFIQRDQEPAEEGHMLRAIGERDRVLDSVVELIESYPGRLESALHVACGGEAGLAVQPVVDSMAASLRFQRGLSCIHNGEYERAVVEFGAAIQHNPGMEHAYAQRGDAHRMLGGYDRALADYSAALRLNPANCVVLTSRGQTYRMLGRMESAIADYDVVLQLDARNVLALNHRGTARAEMGNHDSAIGDFSQALKIDPEYPFTYQNRARSYAARGDLDAAIGDYSQVLRLNPMFALAYVRRGDVYRQKGELERAVADYTEALRLDPLHLHAYVNRGAAYREQGEPNRALSDFAHALKIDNANPWMFLNRGIAHRDNGDFSKALADFDAALRLDSDNHQIYFHRALARQEMGDSEGALLDLDEAIRRKPDAADAYFHRGSLFLSQRDAESAIADLTEAIRLEPANARAYLTRALAHSLDDNLELVVSDCNQAIEIDGSLKRAFMTRGIAYYRQGEHENALTDFDQVLKFSPSDPEALVNQAVVYAKMGNHGTAISGFTRALRVAPKNARALAARAASNRALDRHEESLADFAQAIQIDPRHSVAFCNQRAQVHLMQGEFDLALADCALSLYLEPDNRKAIELREQALNSTEFEVAQQRPAKKARLLPAVARPSSQTASDRTIADDTVSAASARTTLEFETPPLPDLADTESVNLSSTRYTGPVELVSDPRTSACESSPEIDTSTTSGYSIEIEPIDLPPEPKTEIELSPPESDTAEFEQEQQQIQDQIDREKAAQEVAAQSRLADQRREEAAKIFKQNQEKESQRLARLKVKEKAEREPVDASTWMRRAAIAGLIGFLLYLVGPTVWGWVMKPSYQKEEKEIMVADAKVSASELCHRFDIDAVGAQTEFEGRVLEVSGQVKDIKGEGKDAVLIILMDEKKVGRVICKMPNPKSVSQNTMLGKLDRLGMVTLKGKCTGQESTNVKLDGVQLVNVRSN